MGEGGGRRRVGQVVCRHVDGLHRGDRSTLGGGVVDEQQHVLVLFVAEIFGGGQSSQRDAQTRARWLVHLAIDQGDFRFGKVLGIDDLRLLHFVPEVIAFTSPLTDAGEHRETTVVQGDVIDELHDDDGLTDSGTAEESDLTALAVGLEKIDDFDAGFEDFGFGVLIF